MAEATKKTLVRPRHLPGPLPNGADGCHGRWGEDGMCPGVRLAEWLNSLGPDDERFATVGGHLVTNGMVRINWVDQHAGGDHLTWAKDGLILEQCPTCKGTGRVVR